MSETALVLSSLDWRGQLNLVALVACLLGIALLQWLPEEDGHRHTLLMMSFVCWAVYCLAWFSQSHIPQDSIHLMRLARSTCALCSIFTFSSLFSLPLYAFSVEFNRVD
jgi:hypothetical protein